MKYPPGPRNFNACIGLTWRHWWRFTVDPLSFVAGLAGSYGDICFYRAFTKKIYVVNRPEWIRQVLVEEAHRVVKLPRHMRILSNVMGRGLIATEGHFWRQQRRTLQGGFTQEHLAHYAEESESIFRERISQWNPAAAFPIERTCQSLLVEATAAALFGTRLDQDVASELATAVFELSGHLSREMASPVVFPDWFPLPSKRVKHRARQVLNTAVQQILTSSRNRDGSQRNLLDVLDAQSIGRSPTGASMQQVIDEVTTMVIAGSHTTAAAMAWVWHCLTEHPDVQARIRDEVRTATEECPSLSKTELPYLESAIREVLRLFPPAWSLFARLALEDFTLGPYVIPKGAWVVVYPYVTHRDPRYFPDPLRFDPDRFSATRIQEIPKYAYFPYGIGPHVCVGAALANTQMKLLTAWVLRQFEIRRGERTGSQRSQPHIAHISIRPASPIAVELRPIFESQATIAHGNTFR